ncbi:MAG: S49 family peptidase [Planctomycetota bacterium]|nr:MAG: S49 family peptidase [Planctomycetota bacterium]
MIGWLLRRLLRGTTFLLLSPLLLLRGVLGLFSGRRVLVLRLHDAVPWAPELVPPVQRLLRGRRAPSLSIREAVDALDEAARTPKVPAALLELDRARLSLAQAEVLLEALDRFKAQGKKVVVWADGLSGPALALCAAGDRAYGLPEGQVEFLGVRVRAVFLRDLLGVLGVVPQLDHHGDYKTYSDTFTRRSMSAAHREMAEELADDVYELALTPLLLGRGLAREAAQAAIDEGPLPASEAAARGLLDGVRYRDELLAEVGALLRDEAPSPSPSAPRPEDAADSPLAESPSAADARPKGKRRTPSEPNTCTPAQLAARWRRRLRRRRVLSDLPRVRVIELRGAIVPGEVGRGCPAGLLVEALDQAREDRRLAAVVLRVDSPGGSALASDLIWRAAKRLAEEKPLVASVGDVCASGGYYVAVAARRIVAPAASLVGSIGVVSGKLHLAPALFRWGVRVEAVARGARAGMYDPDRPFTPEEAAANRAGLLRFYETFLARVAEGRGKTRDQVDAVAQGRVYTGRRALGLGLVDRLGGLPQALEEACALAGIEGEPEVEHVVPNRPSLLQRLDPRGGGTLDTVLADCEVALALAREPVLAYCPWRVNCGEGRFA